MCGIVGRVGRREAIGELVADLRTLEYRGYDSAGLACVADGTLEVYKAVGKVAELDRQLPPGQLAAVGIAHTRWATHGGVTRENAHPHLDGATRIAVVHNGIIDNAQALRERLEAEGVRFRSETDTEVIPHLVARYYDGDPVAAVMAALAQLQGTYGLAVAFADHPDRLVVARNGSPLVIGLGEGANHVASDPVALTRHTRRVVFLEDGQVALLTADAIRTFELDGRDRKAVVTELDEVHGQGEKGAYPHFMLKEIHEQPESVARCIGGRVQVREGNARLGGLELSSRDLVRVRAVHILGCGTSFHAGLIGAMLIEGLARVPASAEIASEFRHRNPLIDPDALYLAISQSGETYDTLEAVREIKLKGGEVFGVINAVGSSIARLCGRGVYVHSGPEMAVASTKAFTSQVTALMIFSLQFGRIRQLDREGGRRIAEAIARLPERVGAYLSEPGPIDRAVELLAPARYALFMGRGPSWPVAMEGALKLKEIAYVPCESYPAGEMKHGPIAMLDRGSPVVVVVPDDRHRDRCLSNVQEVKARGARTIVVHTAGDEGAAALADVAIPVPRTHPLTSPVVTVLPLQLMAYRTALALGRDIDRPRNLAKSVTVE